jgi:hypothetical protein
MSLLTWTLRHPIAACLLLLLRFQLSFRGSLLLLQHTCARLSRNLLVLSPRFR